MSKKETKLEAILAGAEPVAAEIDHTKPDYNTRLLAALNWYSKNRGSKEARQYLIVQAEATKQPSERIRILENMKDADVPQSAAWVVRMIQRGANLALKEKNSAAAMLEDIFTAKSDVQRVIAKATRIAKLDPEKCVRDFMKVKINEFLGEMEGEIDDWIHKDSKKLTGDRAFYQYLQGKDTPQAYVKDIIEWCNGCIREYGTVILTKDEQIIEGYSNLSPKKVRNLVKWLGSLKQQAFEYGQFKKANRAPRQRKAKPASVQVKRMHYLNETKEYGGLTSVHPTEVIGAEQLWTFNVKTRVLAVYRATGSLGLAVKGTTLLNYDVESSQEKRLRKPEVTLKELAEAGKVALRKLLDNVNAKGKVPRGRINKDTILVRVVK